MNLNLQLTDGAPVLRCRRRSAPTVMPVIVQLVTNENCLTATGQVRWRTWWKKPFQHSTIRQAHAAATNRCQIPHSSQCYMARVFPLRKCNDACHPRQPPPALRAHRLCSRRTKLAATRAVVAEPTCLAWASALPSPSQGSPASYNTTQPHLVRVAQPTGLQNPAFLTYSGQSS